MTAFYQIRITNLRMESHKLAQSNWIHPSTATRHLSVTGNSHCFTLLSCRFCYPMKSCNLQNQQILRSSLKRHLKGFRKCCPLIFTFCFQKKKKTNKPQHTSQKRKYNANRCRRIYTVLVENEVRQFITHCLPEKCIANN